MVTLNRRTRFRAYAKACERSAKTAPTADHHAMLKAIARAWRAAGAKVSEKSTHNKNRTK
jgi:hypothetical protein